ncbi:YkgJ family cysteine cluster protein [uncultured Desulfovibrio sp.]|uniref:YkgJ family cysteine cluster protein n=2 Tax=uncultured Desulfovibrio sp. TaxID=167968 RepID=UPI00260916E2|nr:YkgJ family cysteine cluster protein [uncultured Desulfovibrio sp.]
MDSDDSREFLESLPELKADETFCFDCNPQVPCFNRCCAELTLPLTPYDVARLRRHLGIGSEEFLSSFATMRSFPDTGFPLPMLRMLQGPGEPCPFVGPAGCSVYEDRPGACRCYPLGRGAKMAEDGVSERFFVVREAHCHGFDQGTQRTPRQWFEDQDVVEYNAANDRYMRLMALVRATGKPLEARLATMSVLCLYQLDKFRELITHMRIFEHVDVDAARQAAVMEDSPAGDRAALDFGLDWMELVIFGKSQGLTRK